MIVTVSVKLCKANLKNNLNHWLKRNYFARCHNSDTDMVLRLGFSLEVI